MPQLDPSVFSPQIIWLIITFVALYLIMAKTALPRVGKVLEERQDRIADDLEHAERLKAESVDIEAEYEKSLAEAKLAATNSIRDARDDLQKILDAEQAGADAKISARLSEAEGKIKAAKTEAMSDLEDIAVEAARSIVQKLTGSDLTEGDARRHVKAEIKAVTGKGV